MLETIMEEIVKIIIGEENKRNMDLEERNVTIKAYSEFIDTFTFPFSRRFGKIMDNHISEDRKNESCVKNLKKIKEFIKRFSEEFCAEDKE